MKNQIIPPKLITNETLMITLQYLCLQITNAFSGTGIREMGANSQK